jgi:hypothetical protein
LKTGLACPESLKKLPFLTNIFGNAKKVMLDKLPLALAGA